ncbi:hypothetical protein [Streptomyces sp. NBC_01618]|uniref:hypothetical protein n=1 Tax=Streptomyces sp. NBC_01618 TaxID=2975900 RepID=UPI0038667C1C|nr:hypothetical protein OH735_31855 [Streptomyces sp. NBC_01618]
MLTTVLRQADDWISAHPEESDAEWWRCTLGLSAKVSDMEAGGGTDTGSYMS